MKKFLLMLLVMALCVAQGAGLAQGAVAQGDVVPAQGDAVGGARFTDALGNDVVLSETPKRVVALLGSFAEAYTLAGGTLVGTTEDAVSERALPLGEGVQIIGKTQSPNLELILALEPDFVILSAETKEHRGIGDKLAQMGVACAYFSVTRWADYLDMCDKLCRVTGRPDLYEAQVAQVKKPIEEILARAKANPNYGKKTALLLRAFSTGVKVKGSDNLTGAMLADMGLVNIADSEQTLMENLTMEEIIQQDPDYIFVATMGASEEKAMKALAENLTNNPAWAGLRAVKEGRFVVLDKRLFHYKPNARWAQSYVFLEDLLYGE